MPILSFHLHLSFSNSCVCVSKHVYAFFSSSVFIHTYLHVHIYDLCSVLYLESNYYFLSSVSTISMDTYVTVSIDIPTTLLICLSSLYICVFISLIYEQIRYLEKRGKIEKKLWLFSVTPKIWWMLKKNSKCNVYAPWQDTWETWIHKETEIIKHMYKQINRYDYLSKKYYCTQ